MKWIDIEKQKPIPGARVLIWHPDLYVGIGRWVPSLGYLRIDGSMGFDDARWWMPLPEPPKVMRKRQKRVKAQEQKS
jgi:hypothetical protein